MTERRGSCALKCGRFAPLTVFCCILLFCLLLPPAAVMAEDAYGWPSYEETRVASYVVVDAGTGETILSRDPGKRMANASTTKLLTALVLLEDADFDPERLLVVSQQALTFPCAGAVCMPLKAGEHIRTIDCLAAMLIYSANDMANVIAENYGGAFGAIDPEGLNDPKESRHRYVDRMNARALALGAEDTHFTNPAGFDDHAHYSTANDLARIMREIMRHPLFVSISGSRLYLMPPTDVHRSLSWSQLNTTNGLVLFGAEALRTRYIEAFTCGKTGTTKAAGKCLVAGAKTNDGRTLICVALNITPPGGKTTSFACALPVRALLEEGAKRIGVPEMDPVLRWGKRPATEPLPTASDPVSAASGTAAETSAETGETLAVLPLPDIGQQKALPFSSFSTVQLILMVIGGLMVLALAFLTGWFIALRHAPPDGADDLSADGVRRDFDPRARRPRRVPAGGRPPLAESRESTMGTGAENSRDERLNVDAPDFVDYLQEEAPAAEGAGMRTSVYGVPSVHTVPAESRIAEAPAFRRSRNGLSGSVNQNRLRRPSFPE